MDATAHQRSRIEEAFRREEGGALAISIYGRCIVLAIIAPWLWYIGAYVGDPTLPYLLLAFALSGLLQLWLYRRDIAQPWAKYVFVFEDFALLTVAILGTTLDAYTPWPPQMAYRLDNFSFFYIFIAVTVFSYSPALVVWAGVSVAITWGLGIAWIVLAEGALTGADFDGSARTLESLAFFLDPRFVYLEGRIQEIAVAFLVCCLLAAMVRRARRLVLRQAEAERARGNLARYFSPNMVDRLAGSDGPLKEVKTQKAAVLFADIVGFTAISEKLAPEQVMALLRRFHQGAADTVFRHGGTIDKFIGDAVMATFGTPEAGPRDASQALACALEIERSLERLNEELRADGLPPIAVGIGLHYGPVVTGDIGGEGRFEFAVIGDSVNVASRLQELTRGLKIRMLISSDLAEAVRAEGGETRLVDFSEAPPQVLRNREQPLSVLAYA
ncbi:MAG: adenylate/guanylate cyclase domain-containing protein [Rhodovibrionaceae bacterium]